MLEGLAPLSSPWYLFSVINQCQHLFSPLRRLVGVGAPAGCERIHLVEEEDARVGCPGSGKQLPDGPFALAHVLQRDRGEGDAVGQCSRSETVYNRS